MSNTRTKNSILNFTITFVAGVLLPVFGLVKYSLFIGFYGTEINGIQIAMESAIAIMNIFEICFSLAFRQLLFEPLVKDDKDKVLEIYSKGIRIFRITGTVFLLAGVAIGILFPLFKESPFSYASTAFYFMLLMVPYGISYFLMGPNLVLIADQKEYRINIWIQGCAVARMILMIVIIFMKLPVIWIFVIESTQILVANTVSRHIAIKMYPWLKVVKTDNNNKELLSNIKYTLIQRLEVIATSNTDTLLISGLLNYTSTSVYGAYNYIVDNITKIVNKALESTLNSFGNLFYSDKEDSYHVFMEFFELVGFIASLCGVCVFMFFNDFLGIWLRDSESIFDANFIMTLLLSFNIYYMILRESFIIARDANGLFRKAAGNAVIFTVIKAIMAFVLISAMGINGAILSTTLVYLFVDFTYNPQLLCKEMFGGKTGCFYSEVLIHTLLTLVIGVGLYFVKNALFGGWTVSYMHFFISAAVIGCLSLVVLLVAYWCLFKNFRELVKRVSHSLLRRK